MDVMNTTEGVADAEMALGIGEGSELQAPLARVIIGGLLSSTLVTLVVVPVVYTLFEEGLQGLRQSSRFPDTLGILRRRARE